MQQYIEYVMRFAEENKSHIWLSGSFLHGTATVFSDVDISAFCNTENLNELIEYFAILCQLIEKLDEVNCP